MVTALTRTAVCAALALGTALSVGVQPAAADNPAAPQITGVRLDGPRAYITFVDHADDEDSFDTSVAERDHPDQSFDKVLPGGGVPGTGRTATRQVSVPDGVPVCISMIAMNKAEFSPSSNTVCAEPVAGNTAPPDLGIAFRGNEEISAAQAAQARSAGGAAYTVALSNDGGSSAQGVVVDIATTGGAVTLSTDKTFMGSWTRLGFTCATSPGKWHCTGGTVKELDHPTATALVVPTHAGFGAITGSISGAGEERTDNNLGSLNIHVLG